eukprot:CAMPEP_0196590422 /NCGR_PEP_ID=MMETSP1081-20130531/66599_1 /TAXON_ID=36882 /ORGANISM="Pyramimonas amylifera, Strain CCMP720" /LENGTH=306 /DNA_ID=CAMNT_0041913531 /DNA_START=213 /DNA_END=1133 /DNA_ORIENTATION=+
MDSRLKNKGFVSCPKSNGFGHRIIKATTESPEESSGTKEEPGTFNVPTFLNATPHERKIRKVFYEDTTKSVVRAVNAGVKRLKVVSEFPELNTEMDVYRVGTLLEMMRVMATELANDGKKVRVCVQAPMGEGIFKGLPITLNGIRRIMEMMDWGEDMLDNFIFLGAVGEEEVKEEDDVFIVIMPTSIVGFSIIPYLESHCKAAGDRPVIIFNPKVTDIPSSGGVMRLQGRDERLAFEKTFETVHHFRLLYNKPYHFPIYGALRKSYGNDWEIFKRTNITRKIEDYVYKSSYPDEPNPEKITKAIRG